VLLFVLYLFCKLANFHIFSLLDYGAITIQSKCYFPDYKKNETLDEETETNVTEYVWNIFCLYTDLMEKLLKQRNVVYQRSGDFPKGVGKDIQRHNMQSSK